jgi:hypothetical protein
MTDLKKWRGQNSKPRPHKELQFQIKIRKSLNETVQDESIVVGNLFRRGGFARLRNQTRQTIPGPRGLI